MHVVQALASLDIGGSELVVVETTEYLCASGHQVSVLARSSQLAGRVNAAGAELLNWPIGRKRPGTLRYIRQLRAWLAENKPDIVHAHSRLPAWVCYLALRKLPPGKRPLFITSVHGQYSVNRYSAIMARGDHVIAVSQHIRDYTLQHYLPKNSQRLHVIHGGISRQAFPFGYKVSAQWRQQTLAQYPALRNKRILLLPGRLSRYKGHAHFIDLIASLSAEIDDIHGVILGQTKPGSRYQRELEDLVSHNALSDRLTFTGARTDMRDWMAASSLVFNLCSDPPEAFGRTVPEALALGVPVLAWNHGGVKEVLLEMFSEGAVTPGDQPALLQKTRKFLHQPPVVVNTDSFSLETSMRKTLDLYDVALGTSDI